MHLKRAAVWLLTITLLLGAAAYPVRAAEDSTEAAAAESTADPVSEDTAAASAEESTAAPVSEDTAAASDEESTAAPTEAGTAASTETSTAAPTEASTAAPTEAGTAASTEASTAASTEASTAAPTEASTPTPTEATQNPRETQQPEDTFVDEEAGDYGPDICADTYCVLDMESGEVVISCGMDRKMYPASCTKILTALLVLENVPDLDQQLTFTPTAINIDIHSSTLIPKAMVGEVMTVRDALYGMLLQSANECGAMLGEYVGGSEAGFAEMMNKRAEEIGCVNSHFVNAYGIHDPEHYTCAYDLALILREAMQNPDYRELNAATEYTIPVTNFNAPRTFGPGHAMLNGSYPEPEGVTVIGGKTGSTPQAGKVLTTAAEKDGREIVAVLMKSNADNTYTDASVLLEYGFGLLERTMRPVEWVPVEDHVTVPDGMRLRFSPSLYGGVYKNCAAGETFERLGIYGDWSKLLADGKIRYAATELLVSDDPEHVPVTEAWVPGEEEETEESETPSEEEESTTEKETAESGSSSEPEESGTEDPDAESTDPGADSGDRDSLLSPMFLIPAGIIAAALLSWIIVLIVRTNWRRKKKKA